MDKIEPVAMYNPANALWAAPGDQQEDAWIVRFCDKDCREAIFTGPDAEREAWEHWNRYAPAFNMYVFRLASLAHPAQHDAGAVARVAKAMAQSENCCWEELGKAMRDNFYRLARAALAAMKGQNNE